MKKADTGINIHKICKLLDVPLSSYYKELEDDINDPKTESVISRIKELHEEHLHCFGCRRMHKELLKEGFTIGIFKVARLMKDSGIVAKIPKNLIIIQLVMKTKYSEHSQKAI